MISIVVPAYNEEKNIGKLIERIFAAVKRENLKDFELIVVDDNSEDNTTEIVKNLSKKYRNLKLLRKVGPRGKIFSLIQGFKSSSGKIIGFIDADLEYPPEKLPKMIKLIIENEADVVVTKRIFTKISLVRKFFSKVYSFFFGKILLGLNVEDPQSGEKVFKREVFEKIKVKGSKWAFDTEFLFRAKKLGYRIVEVPIYYEARGPATEEVFRMTAELFFSAIKLFLTG